MDELKLKRKKKYFDIVEMMGGSRVAYQTVIKEQISY